MAENSGASEIILSALKDLACAELEKNLRRSTSAGPVVGMFRIRREMEITEFAQRILAAAIADTEDIRIDDITIKRPQLLQFQLFGFAHLKISPPMPVNVKVLGIEVSVDVSEAKLAHDGETGLPALSVKTASALKPDVVFVFGRIKEQHMTPLWAPSYQTVMNEIGRARVPAKYRVPVQEAVAMAWGPKQIAPMRMQAVTGQINADQSEVIAKSIVTDMLKTGMIPGGMFFWFRLGYWLVRIIASLIRSRSRT